MVLINQKLKTLYLLILCSCLSYTVSLGQQTWERSYGGTQHDGGHSVQQTADGGYIIGGYTRSYGAGESDMYLVKTDLNGDTLWTQTYGDSTIEDLNEVQQTTDGGYILAGSKVVGFGVLSQWIYLVKTDLNGDTLWTKTYGDWGDNIGAYSVQQTTDGGYIVLGDADIYLLKLDAQGDTLWTKTYGNMGSEGRVVRQTTDGGYIIGGSYTANNVPVYGIIKTDAQGDTLWTHTYPFETSIHMGGIKDVRQTQDGGYIAVGSQVDPGGNLNYGMMFKTDSSGTLDWRSLDTLTTGVSSMDYYGVSLAQDGGFVYTGTITKNITSGTGFRQRTALLLRKRDANGNVLWEREHAGGHTGYSVERTANGGIVVAGIRINQGGDMYVFLADSLGNYRTNAIMGNVYQDLDLSCDQTNIDRGLAGIIVQASLNGVSTFDYYGTTDSLGYYFIPCQVGTYTISIPNLHPYYNLSCPQNTGTVTAQTYDTVDFPLEVLALCPVMNVDVSAPLLRQIVPSVYSIQYCNTGTEAAQNAEITVEIDTFLNILNFSQAPTSQNGNNYVFNIGTVGIGDCGNLYITVQVDTSAILGQTHCLEVSITPDSLCLPTNWTGMLLDVSGTCQNDSIHFNIENLSTTSIATPRDYWVFEDNIIMRTGMVTVPNGGSSTISVPASPRKFYRIEVAQESGIPWTVSDSIVSAFVEGCISDANGDFNVGFPTQFPNGHAPTFRAIDCQQNIGSFDPNNKEAQPVGYHAEHYINQNQYIDYKINFQNTGTDTAFFVTLIDTLSPYLDPASVQLTSASHLCTWRIKGNGILEVNFDYIMLPDSNVNEPASHGFAKFRIEQQVNNPVGTIINNFADIYFDFNAPIQTNTTYHEIGANFYILTITPLQDAPKILVNAFPNPFTYGTTIQVNDEEYDNLTLMVYDLMGRQVTVLSEENTNQIELPRNNLENGVYLFKLLGNGKPISSGKIVAQ
ncbi:T9SS type A sorting domain-containing protein [Aureispira anguillae]|uniref:T9SS type A sorting domain-containing protein n=1 Tax=Aureispira anguillae TaxID=2864201 RepID=A0A915YB72_9BACT|nr:T9SS type A sorting domain-containing protein [Aureispira anguillae]BDS09869.1 T9SS type A sorting domain-containing protein [Aureispira anguillae]